MRACLHILQEQTRQIDQSCDRRSCNRYLEFAELLEEAGVQIPMKHCSNSAGIIRDSGGQHLNAVRAGITIYGMYPSNEVERDIVKLIPAMELKSHVSLRQEIAGRHADQLRRNFCS